MRWLLALVSVMLAAGTAAGPAVLAAPRDGDRQPPVESGEDPSAGQPTITIGSANARNGEGDGWGPNAVFTEVEPVWSPPSPEQVETLNEISPNQQPAASYDNVLDADSDGDQIPDALDNCTLGWNADQADSNGNGVGDACETSNQPPPPADTDGDGVRDDRDNCWQISNPSQKDADGDGLGNGCDEGSAPFLIGDNPVEAQRIVEDAVIATGPPIDAPVVDALPPVSGGQDASPDYEVGPSGGEPSEPAPGDSSAPYPDAGPGHGRSGDARGNLPAAAAAADAGSVDDGGRDTPVERGDRPRRNPALTHESGPVMPPPRSRLRMDEVLPGFDTIARIDAGRLGGASLAAPRPEERSRKERTHGDHKQEKAAARADRDLTASAEAGSASADVPAAKPAARPGAEPPVDSAPSPGVQDAPAARPEPTPSPTPSPSPSPAEIPAPTEVGAPPPAATAAPQPSEPAEPPPSEPTAAPSRPRMPVPIEEGAIVTRQEQDADRRAREAGDVAGDSSGSIRQVVVLRWQSPRPNGGVRDYLETPEPSPDPVAEMPALDPPDAEGKSALGVGGSAAAEPGGLKSTGDGKPGKDGKDRKRGGEARKDSGADRAEDPAQPETGWSADTGYRGGEATSTGRGKILGAIEDDIYRTQRTTTRKDRGNSFVYAIEVPADGFYRVRLHFAETQENRDGARVFDVDAEGEPALVDFDIHAEVGANTAVVKSFDVDVDDGTLEIEFRGVSGRPVVSAIEVLQQVQKLPPVDKTRARHARKAMDAPS